MGSILFRDHADAWSRTPSATGLKAPSGIQHEKTISHPSGLGSGIAVNCGLRLRQLRLLLKL
jgi:hypothetical protein